jgi:hypothetical protein
LEGKKVVVFPPDRPPAAAGSIHIMIKIIFISDLFILASSGIVIASNWSEAIFSVEHLQLPS